MENQDLSLLQLRQHGVVIDPALSPATIAAEDLYRIVVDSLIASEHISTATAKKQFPSSLPSAASARYGICGGLSEAMQTAGFAAAAYDHLMYPAEATTKQVLTFLAAAVARAAEVRQQADGGDGSVDADSSHAGGAAGERPTVRDSLQLLAARVALGREKTGGGKSGKGRVGPVLLQPRSRRHTTKNATSSASAAAPVFYAAQVVPFAEDGSILQQTQQVHEWVAKCPMLATQQNALPSLSTVYRNTLSEALSAHHASSAAIRELIAQSVADHQATQDKANVGDSRKGSVASNSKKSKKKKEATHQEVGGSSQLQSAAIFMNTSEDGLEYSTARALAAREAEEKQLIAAEEASLDASEKHVSERVARREEETASLKDRIHSMKRMIKAKKGQLSGIEASIAEKSAVRSALLDELSATEAAAFAERDAARARQEVLSMLGDPESSIAKLNLAIETLNQQRAAGREELNAKLLKAEAKRDAMAAEAEDAGAGRNEKLAVLRKEARSLKKIIKQKTAEIKQLQVEYERTPKEIDRSLFLRLIFDMTANIRKQQSEVDKTLADTRSVEGDIKTLEGKISKIFSSLEEKVYGAASTAKGSDDFARTALKNILSIHESYNALIAVIEERRVVLHERHEVEEKADKLQRTVDGLNISRVETDMQVIVEENDALASQLETEEQEEEDE